MPVDFSSIPNVTSNIQLEILTMRIGGYADVYQAKFTGSDDKNVKVAVKYLRIDSMKKETRSDLTRRYQREIYIWSRLSHPNIIKIFGICDQLPTVHGHPLPGLVSIWCEGGIVTDYLSTVTEDKSFKLIQATIVVDILAGLAYLHQQNIVHADIKPANILVSGEGRAQLADFGLSVQIAEWTRTLAIQTNVHGTWRYMAPEQVLRDEAYAFTTDVWASGCVFIQIYTGLKPYEWCNEMRVSLQMDKGERPYADSDQAEWSCLASDCIRLNATERPSVAVMVARANMLYLRTALSLEAPANSDWNESAIQSLARIICQNIHQPNWPARLDLDSAEAFKLLAHEQCATPTATTCRKKFVQLLLNDSSDNLEHILAATLLTEHARKILLSQGTDEQFLMTIQQLLK